MKNAIINSAARRGDTWDVNRHPETEVLPKLHVRRLKYSSNIIIRGATLYV